MAGGRKVISIESEALTDMVNTENTPNRKQYSRAYLDKNP